MFHEGHRNARGQKVWFPKDISKMKHWKVAIHRSAQTLAGIWAGAACGARALSETPDVAS
jgi:hypothetical protein